MSPDHAARKIWITSGAAVVFGLAAAKLLFHLYTGRRYGYFVDELYYLACSDHLAWGYVDQPPLIALITKVVRTLLGDSLAALRLLPALAGAGLVLLTGFLARELGGRRFAQGFAALTVLVAPGFLGLSNLLTMNAFEPLFWMGCAYLLIRMIKTGDRRLWLCFGVLAGVGLENKHSMLIFGFAILAGLLLTPQRRLMRGAWLWIGGAAALLIFAPNLLWNVRHHFPFLEIQANIRASHRNVDLPPLRFLAEETLAMLPLSLPIWLAGLWFYFGAREGKAFRALGCAFVIAAAIIMELDPRIYYLFPAYPLLFASGAVLCEKWFESPLLGWLKIAAPAVLFLLGAALAPLAVPVLPVPDYLRYTQAVHLQQPRIENAQLGPLPQLFADQFGWDEMAKTVARAFNSLPPDVRTRTAIFGQNYGQAGAIDFFGPKYGLPKAIGGHQNYFLWGPRGYTGESMLVMGDRRERLEELFGSVELVGHAEHPYSMPYQHIDIFYCRGLKQPLGELWPRIKAWD